MIGALRSGIAKGKIKGKLHKILDHEKASGTFSGNPMRTAMLLVDSIYMQAEDVFEGKLGAKPDTDVSVAFALANGLTSDYEWGADRDGVVMAFMRALAPLNSNSKRLTQIDLQLIEHIAPFIDEVQKEFDSSTLGQELSIMLENAARRH